MKSNTRIILFIVFSLKVFGDLFGLHLIAKQVKSGQGQGGILGLFFEYLPSIAITAGNFVVPLLCDQIALIERYSPSTTVIVALLRFALVFLFEREFVRAFEYYYNHN